MIFPTIMFWVWLATQQPHAIKLHCDTSVQPHETTFSVGGINDPCFAEDENGNLQRGSFKPAPAEHVIEIRTKREDKKDAIGEEKPAPSSCNVSDGTYLVCITEPVTHWHCADADHVLEGGFDELAYWDVSHPNKPYCIRVTREIWIDGHRWGVLKEGQ